MDNLQIVAFCHASQPSASLHHLITDVANSVTFQLPELNGCDPCEDATLQQALQLSPELVLVEMTPGYDVEAFITAYRRLYVREMPGIIGVFDGDPGEEELSRVAEVSLDSYLFTRWSDARLKDRFAKLLRLRSYQAQLRDQLEDSSKTALTAMRAASEVGLVMQLIDWLQSAQSHTEVSHCLLKLCRSLDLTAALLIMDGEQPRYFPDNTVTSSTRKLLDGVYDQDNRIVSRKRFMAFKLEQLVLLVTNAPWQDDERYGRYRDILLQAVAIAEAKARTITINNLIVAQHDQVTSIMTLIKNLSGDTHRYAKDIMQQLSGKLSLASVSLDLTDEQERVLQTLSNEAYESIELLYQSSDALESHFHSLVASITRVRELTTSRAEPVVDPFADDDDITLF